MGPTKEDPVLNTKKTIQPEPEDAQQAASANGSSKLFLFQYVTLLASGLVLLSLLSFTGFALLNHWLGEAGPAGMFSGVEYSLYIYLLASLVVFGILHAWMRMCVRNVSPGDQPSAVRVFRAIFLTILVLTIIGSMAALAYVGIDMLLGAGDYSAKSAWLVVLDSLQVILWASLLWWYFKQPRSKAIVYTASVGVVAGVMAVLLLTLPIFSKRDAVIDSRTSSDLSAIAAKINEYARKNNKLPAALGDVKLDDKVASRVGNYEYLPGEASAPKSMPTTPEDYLGYSSSSSGSAFSYKLCATFKTDTTKDEDDTIFLSYFGGSGAMKHPSGRHCFDHSAYGASDDSKIEPAEPLQSIVKPTSPSPLY